MNKAAWIDADEASALLGVSRATLYAYVSRGRIRSETSPDDPHRRRYSRDDIERMQARTRERRHPEKAAEQALHWGLPILESAITLIADGCIYYRGRDAAALARTSSVAEVAALIWTGAADGSVLGAPPKTAVGKRSKAAAPFVPRARAALAPFVPRAQAALALTAAADPAAFDLRPRSVAQAGWRILHLLAGVAANAAVGERPIDEALAAAWHAPNAASLLRAALILCADHELNVSAFTARCVASAGSSPYGVVIAGLAALEGTKHGGTTARIETLWDALCRAPDARAALTERLRRGEPIDGFGHPLYRDGDPRAALLLGMLPKTKAAALAHEIVRAADDILGERPTIDFALVALARALSLPDGAALTLFALGRTIGWLGHAIEQYEQDAMIRPRARYVGERPRGE